jgi:hypothetical protein
VYDKYLKKFANKTMVSYEEWKKIAEIIDDCEIYIGGFERKQYFDYLYAFYEKAYEENRDIMDVVKEYQKAMQNTSGYQFKQLNKAFTELIEGITKETQPYWQELEKLLIPKWKRIWRKIIKYLGGE